MQKQYPEVHSLEESLAILKKYKDDSLKDNLKNFRQNLDLEQNKGMSL
ncbi:hypothetical protein OR051_001808 [Campylobacter coli]|nr:hypothetical protein [Campylobacter coli]